MHHQRLNTVKTARQGFTLIELLVVIGIVMLLAMLTNSSLNLVQRSARQMSCGSNQRQLGLAITTYVTDNRGYLPQPFCTNSGATWQGGPLRSYLSDSAMSDADLCKGKGIIGCPENPAKDITFINPVGFYTSRFASYALNNAIAGQRPNWGAFTLRQVNQPGQKIFVMDALYNWTFDFGTNSFHPTLRGGFIHRGRANCLFLDGHVEARAKDITWNELVR